MPDDLNPDPEPPAADDADDAVVPAPVDDAEPTSVDTEPPSVDTEPTSVGDAGPAPVDDDAAATRADDGDGHAAPAGNVVQRTWHRLAHASVESWVTFGIVAFCVGFVLFQLHPEKIFSDTTPAGGDMGAHVWAPAYLRDHLLTKGRLSGWTPDWYAGFPAFQFYMIVPSLLIALLSLVIPYGIAFKVVAVSGVVTLPAAAYGFGRLARLPFPAPALLSVGAVLFLFDRSFSIYGGNIPSTLAGEFAFSISLSLALIYLGVVARGLETGRYRAWAAGLLALTALCHLIPFIFALVGTGIWLLLRPGKGQLRWALTMVPVGGALTAFWTLPFFLRRGYLNDMGWEKIVNYDGYLWARDKLDAQLVNQPDLKWVIAFAAVGLLLSLVYRQRAGLFLALMAGAFALGFRYMPQGRLWNARLLPFYYLSLYLLAAVGIAELVRLLAALFAPDVTRPLRWLSNALAVVAFSLGMLIVALPLQNLPGGKVQADGSYKWLFLTTRDKSFIDSWSDWNFTGYEGFDRPAVKDAAGNPTGELGPPTYKKSYPEYHDIVQTMADLGKDPAHGCGRAMWEHEEQHDRYGTPMALMLLPFWTDGCIGSMEGLYFEASTTTPYHFLNQDELSTGPSNAQRDLPYGPGAPTKTEFDRGVRHLQMLGVTYYMAITDNMKQLAAQNPSLSQVATSGPWTVYQVADAPLVSPLRYEPAVLTGQSTTGREWQDTAVCWYVNEEDWDVPLAADGPPEWQRVERTVEPSEKATPAEQCLPARNWGWFSDDGGPEYKPLEPVQVSNISEGDDSISFDVDKVGVPVLVKESYFPNWKVSGAEGPYRVTPNLMVVIPTENHVELTYGWTGVDLVSWLITFAGIAGLVLLIRRPTVPVAPPRQFWGRAERPDLYPSPATDLRFAHERGEIVVLPPDPDAFWEVTDAYADRSVDDSFGTPLAGPPPGSPEPRAPEPGERAPDASEWFERSAADWPAAADEGGPEPGGAEEPT